jgi:Sugar (and other) transporter
VRKAVSKEIKQITKGTTPMTAMTASQYREGAMTSEERMVIFASSLGTVFEWYDFYIYGTLAPILAAQFFSGVNPTAAFIFTLLAFAAGFAVRPFGALFFGRLGDIVGRKYTFIITMTLMGVGTFSSDCCRPTPRPASSRP